MFESLNYIELSGIKVPIKCDLLVLERIQDKYGSIPEFENKLTGFVPSRDEDGEPKRNEEGNLLGVYGLPDLDAMKNGLIWMAEEGYAIEAEEGCASGAEEGMKLSEMPDKNTLIRMVDKTVFELSDIIHEEFNRCFMRKNEKTTQRETKTAESSK